MTFSFLPNYPARCGAMEESWAIANPGLRPLQEKVQTALKDIRGFSAISRPKRCLKDMLRSPASRGPASSPDSRQDPGERTSIPVCVIKRDSSLHISSGCQMMKCTSTLDCHRRRHALSMPVDKIKTSPLRLLSAATTHTAHSAATETEATAAHPGTAEAS